MADLMHPRAARNYAQLGYFPTDTDTLRGIVNLIAPGNGRHTFLDPCCGCGTALAGLATRQQYPFAATYGIELHSERAATAAGTLHKVLCGNALTAHVTPQSVDCLFLNPPYGWQLKDGDSMEKAERLEHQFLSRYFPALCAGGILIYIAPKASLDEKRQHWLLTRFEDLTVWEAATNRFDQIVVIARKRRGIIGKADEAMLENFVAWQSGKASWPVLPQSETDRYRLSDNDKVLYLADKTLDVAGITALIRECPGLWRDFRANFTIGDDTAIRPLHDLTEWHTCLLISSGVVSGLVDNGQRRLLVKGKTGKSKHVRIETDAEGNVVAEEHHDRFRTVIKAIDLTEGSADYGRIFNII